MAKNEQKITFQRLENEQPENKHASQWMKQAGVKRENIHNDSHFVERSLSKHVHIMVIITYIIIVAIFIWKGITVSFPICLVNATKEKQFAQFLLSPLTVYKVRNQYK